MKNKDNKEVKNTRISSKLESVKVKKSMLNRGRNDKEVKKLLSNAMKGKQVSVSSSPQDILAEVQRILIENNLTLDFIVSKYKELLESEYEKPKASDVLKALESLQKLHGITESKLKEDQDLPRPLADALASGQVDAFIIGITNKTQEYIEKLESNKKQAGKQARQQEDTPAEDGEIVED